jgi:hypothetical protein
MIYPILDEMTLDRVDEEMRAFNQISNFAQIEYCKKHNLKVPPNLAAKFKSISKFKNQRESQSDIDLAGVLDSSLGARKSKKQ